MLSPVGIVTVHCDWSTAVLLTGFTIACFMPIRLRGWKFPRVKSCQCQFLMLQGDKCYQQVLIIRKHVAAESTSGPLLLRLSTCCDLPHPPLAESGSIPVKRSTG